MDYPGSPISAVTGSKAAVTAIQTALNARGVGPIEANGVFGPETDAAVRLFQARFPDAKGQPLAVDGVVGPMTWAALFGRDPPEAAPPTDPLLRRTLEVAAAKIGVMEVPPGSNAGPEVEAFLAGVGLHAGYPWCAAFVYACFHEAAGAGANPCPRTGGVHDMWGKLGTAKRLRYTPAQVKAHPELVGAGQLFFLDTGGGNGHVGFIEAVSGVYLTTIEGNTNDGGSREGVGVFRRTQRKIGDISLGVADLSRAAT